jgi:hypothetical protein
LYQRLKAYVAIDLEAATLIGVDVAPVRMRYCSKNEAGFLPVLPPISGFAKSTAHAKILRSSSLPLNCLRHLQASERNQFIIKRRQIYRQKHRRKNLA